MSLLCGGCGLRGEPQLSSSSYSPFRGTIDCDSLRQNGESILSGICVLFRAVANLEGVDSTREDDPNAMSESPPQGLTSDWQDPGCRSRLGCLLI